MHVHRRVIGREIQSAEVIPFGFDLRSRGAGEAQPVEDLDDFLGDPGDGVLRSNPAAAPRHGEIHTFTSPGMSLTLERLATLVERSFEIALERVGAGPQLGLLCG